MAGASLLGLLWLVGACSGPQPKSESPHERDDGGALDTSAVDTGVEDTGTDDTGSPPLPDACIAQLTDEVADWSEAGATLTLGEVQTCSSPLDGPRWVEVGGDLGFLASISPDVEHVAGGSAVVDDFDLDGDLDFIVAFREGQTILYRNSGDDWEAEDLELNDMGGTTISLADVDSDGRRDIVLPGPPVRILKNTPDGLVVELEGSLNGMPYLELAPGDFDGDGDIDLFGLLSTGEWEEGTPFRDQLLINDGSGWFDPVALEGDGPTHMGFDAQVFDWGGDGLPDVWVVNDQGSTFGPNVLWRNDGGILTDGTDECACGIMQAGMGGDVGDYNNDGIPDLYGSATNVNALLEGQSDGSFLDVTLVTDACPLDGGGSMSWGAIFLDYDNDGREDLLVAEGDFWRHGDAMALRGEMPLDLLRQVPNPEGRPSFEDVSTLLGDDLMGTWRAVVARDFNGDGVLDVLATDMTKRPHLFLSEGCTEAAWIEVHAPVGSQIDVCAGGLRQTRWSSTESSWGGAGIPTAHLGLGTATQIDRLQIRLPSGELVVAEELEGRRVVKVAGY